jgi:hypothetical protein
MRITLFIVLVVVSQVLANSIESKECLACLLKCKAKQPTPRLKELCYAVKCEYPCRLITDSDSDTQAILDIFSDSEKHNPCSSCLERCSVLPREFRVGCSEQCTASCIHGGESGPSKPSACETCLSNCGRLPSHLQAGCSDSCVPSCISESI